MDWLQGFLYFKRGLYQALKKITELTAIPLDLILVGDDFWLERYEVIDDYQEDTLDYVWSFKKLPVRPTETKPIVTLNINESEWTYIERQTDALKNKIHEKSLKYVIKKEK